VLVQDANFMKCPGIIWKENKGTKVFVEFKVA